MTMGFGRRRGSNLKKLLISLFILGMIPCVIWGVYPQSSGVIPALDGSGKALGPVIDGLPGTPNYFVSDATITLNTTLNVRTYLNRDAQYVLISNDSTANAIGVSFSNDSSIYGSTMNISAGESFSASRFFLFRNIRLSPTTSVPYRIWAW